MAHHSITLRVDAQGNIQTEPRPIVVAPGDTVAWKSDQGDVSVSFDDSPFDGDHRFAGQKGRNTTAGKIRADVPRGKFFECKASVGGKSGEKVYGVEIVP